MQDFSGHSIFTIYQQRELREAHEAEQLLPRHAIPSVREGKQTVHQHANHACWATLLQLS
jgi:hypothetical protein